MHFPKEQKNQNHKGVDGPEARSESARTGQSTKSLSQQLRLLPLFLTIMSLVTCGRHDLGRPQYHSANRTIFVLTRRLARSSGVVRGLRPSLCRLEYCHNFCRRANGTPRRWRSHQARLAYFESLADPQCGTELGAAFSEIGRCHRPALCVCRGRRCVHPRRACAAFSLGTAVR